MARSGWSAVRIVDSGDLRVELPLLLGVEYPDLARVSVVAAEFQEESPLLLLVVLFVSFPDEDAELCLELIVYSEGRLSDIAGEQQSLVQPVSSMRLVQLDSLLSNLKP